MLAKLLATATIGKTHGVDGYLRLYSLSGEYKHLKKLTECVAKLPNGDELSLTVDSILVKGDLFLMRFASYMTPEKARYLSKATLFIPRSAAPKLKKGEYYIADLYNMDVLVGGERVGIVKETMEGGQSLLLVVEKIDNKKEYLIPNLPYFVSDINVEDNSLNLLKPELLDIQ